MTDTENLEERLRGIVAWAEAAYGESDEFPKACREAADALATQRQLLVEAASALIEVAANCHRAKWRFQEGENDRPAINKINRAAFDALHSIGDLAKAKATRIQSSVGQSTGKSVQITFTKEECIRQGLYPFTPAPSARDAVIEECAKAAEEAQMGWLPMRCAPSRPEAGEMEYVLVPKEATKEQLAAMWPHAGDELRARRASGYTRAISARPDECAEMQRAMENCMKELEWFCDREATIQSKFDLYGPEDTAKSMKATFKRARAALTAALGKNLGKEGSS